MEEDVLKAEKKTVSRDTILELEQIIKDSPDAFLGDTDICPLKHSFCDGMYVREIFIPAGKVITGKIHKHFHPNFLLKGIVNIVTEQGGAERFEAPMSMISAAGTKRAICTITDTVWVTVHLNPTNTRDLAELEKSIIAPTYQQLESFLQEKKMLDAHPTSTNCGLIALGKMLDLKKASIGTLISLAKDNGIALYGYKIPTELLKDITTPCILHSDNHFVFVDGDKPDFEYSGYVLSEVKLPYPKIPKKELNITGSTYVAAGTAVATIGYGIYKDIDSNKKSKAADAAMPANEDPEVRNYLAELDRKRKAMESGSYYANQYNELLNQEANTDQGIISTSGGAGGAAISGLLRSQRNTGKAYDDLITKNEGNVTNTNKMYLDLLDQIAGRKQDLALLRSDRLYGQAAEEKKAAEQNIMAGVTRAIPLGGKTGSVVASPATSSNPNAGLNITNNGGYMLPDRNSMYNAGEETDTIPNDNSYT